MASFVEQQIRELFEELFPEAAARDIDALAARIDPHVRPHEHQGPLEYLGVQAIRNGGDARRSAPDLQIVVRDDLAETWGLSRTRFSDADGTAAETWSPGTRTFQMVDGAWRAVHHRHPPFPPEPATGRARTRPRAARGR